MNHFEKITLENIKEIEKYLQNAHEGFCDFTPFVLLMWQEMYKTEYTVRDSVLYLKYEINKKVYYTSPCKDIYNKLEVFKSFPDFDTLTLVSEGELAELEKRSLVKASYTDDGFHDYVYLGENLASLKGRKYAGQRNHINKLESLFPDWKYERVTPDNACEVLDFFNSLSSFNGDVSHDYEAGMVKRYLANYSDFKTLGGFISAGGKIISFAFGEIVNDMLFVHIEKANRSVQGAYPLIVREFARANPARLINREEDMGIEGLRTSKLSYHPEKLLKKYIVEVV